MKKIFILQRFAKKINLTKKADVYSNTDESRIINALGGNDSVSNGGNYVTISGGAGHDSISNSGANYVSINGDAGNDYISSSSSYRYSVYSSSYYVTLSGGKGNDTIYNNSPNSKIDGGTGNDSIRNYGSNTKIDGGSGHDYIYASGNNSTISGGTGNDTIINSFGYYSSISGGAGNDYISSSNSSYNSSVYSSSYYVTLNGGKGNDIINLNGGNQILNYAEGDGKDIVVGFNSDDTLRITKGSYSVTTDENDVIVTVGNGSVTLKGMAGQKLSITNSKGKTTTKTYGSASSESVAELWFDSKNNVDQDDLKAIVESKSPAAIEGFKTSNTSDFVAGTSLTSGLDSNKN